MAGICNTPKSGEPVPVWPKKRTPTMRPWSKSCLNWEYLYRAQFMRSMHDVEAQHVPVRLTTKNGMALIIAGIIVSMDELRPKESMKRISRSFSNGFKIGRRSTRLSMRCWKLECVRRSRSMRLQNQAGKIQKKRYPDARKVSYHKRLPFFSLNTCTFGNTLSILYLHIPCMRINNR